MTLQAYSILDLCGVNQHEGSREALQRSLRSAQAAEQAGFKRFWMAEHHNMQGIASSATAVALAHIGQGTQQIRIGSGGVMLPNHAPLVIAEQFGTLAALYPDRVDLGLGRAPGTDSVTVRALRRDPMAAAETFPEDVQELLHYLDDSEPGQPVIANPGQGSHVPVWLLGSSLYSAQLAAYLGLPYSFAAHFAPRMLTQAINIYRQQFRPSKYLKAPYAKICVNMILADTQQEAELLFTTMQQSVLNLLRNKRGKLTPPNPDVLRDASPHEKDAMQNMLQYAFVGTPQNVAPAVQQLLETLQPDELMIHKRMFDLDAQLHSIKLSGALLSELLK
ncbi:LLM class flavin-dependent oxidoreductase [Brackiella oedipodis]|uniref:LLM class flavin-dependent oxidoreductase n=1 Tax=Brackiella oedipodis TaxID=124225 RepID=UPI00048C2A22|nr:LLM class flavin-dependent oxidoreductase [Brackiella oedipodis]